MAKKNVVNQVVYKNEKGELVDYTDIGADFSNVVDSKTGYSLKQFFDNYRSFLSEVSLMTFGPTQPENNQVLLWIDTNE